MPNKLTVDDLPRTPAYGVCLYCPTCGDTFSACRGDYFWMPVGKAFRCQHDRTLLQLRQRSAPTYQPITTQQAERSEP
jgi:hypothetical protein